MKIIQSLLLLNFFMLPDGTQTIGNEVYLGILMLSIRLNRAPEIYWIKQIKKLKKRIFFDKSFYSQNYAD